MTTKPTTYLVTKEFIAGLLKGLTVTETTPVRFTVGKRYKPCAGSSAYVIRKCTPVNA
jgi:hypothetical protein